MFVYFFIFFYSSNHAFLRLTLNSLSQALTSLSHLLSKLSQTLTAAGPTRSSTSPPIEARRHQPTNQPTSSNSQTVDQPQTHSADLPQTHAANLPQTHAIDQPLMLSTLSNSLSETLTSLSPRCRRQSMPPTQLAIK